MSVADSLISEGTNDELDVRADENMFELRVVSAKLNQDYFSALPATFVSFDFFQHDTQATPMRQGLSPEYDFTAQYILVVDDLFLHYAATTVLTLDVNQSWGVECQQVARCDVPLRELLQAKQGKHLKYAQLFSVADADADALPGQTGPRVVGSVVYEIRMRRRIDVPVHSFMQRFPDVASLALAPARPGHRNKEAVITIRSCSSLRLRPHGLRPAPYVHFEFFEFGQQETSAAGDGSDPRFEQSFRFPVDMDSADFSEYLKQASLTFTVFDENEEDTEAMLGRASMPLAELRVTDSVQHELPLQDLRQQPAGSVTVSIELRDVAQPKAISLQAAGTDADGAAVQIQSSARGHTTRSAAAGDGPVPLVLRLQRLVLTEEVQRQEGLASVAIEVDFFGLVPDLKTPAIKPKVSGNNVDFEHVIQITTKCPEADVLRRVVQSKDDQDSDIFLTVVASTRTGSKSLGVAFINLKEQSRLGSGKSVTLPVRGPDERSVGTLEVSLDATAAVHRAVGADTLRVDVMELLSYDALRQDTSVTEIFVEVDMAGLKDATHLKTKALKKNAAALDFGYSHSVSLAPGSRAQQELQKALKTGDSQDSDVFFVLKGRTPQGTERELGEGSVLLTDLLRDDADKVRVALPLKSKGGGGPTLMVSVLGVEALRRMKTMPPPAAQPDALRIDVRDLTLAGPAKSDTKIAELFVEIDALGLAGKTALVTPSVKKKGAGPVRFDYSHTLALPDGSTELAKLRTALVTKDEQDSDVYFTVKARDPRGDVHELGQAFVNLEQMGRENKDKDGSIDVVAPKGAVIVGSLNVSVSALGVMRRARAFKPAAAADAVRVEVGGLALSSAVRQDASVTDIWVEVDLLDLASAAQLRTKPQRKTAAALDFGYSHSVSVAPGSRAQQELQKALRSADEQDSDVYFSLKTRDGRGQEKELGQGYVSLLKLARDGRNLVSEQVVLQGGGKGASVGTLTVSVLAAETLQAALGTAAAPTNASLPRAVGPSAPPSLDDQLSIRVEALSLAASYQRDPRQQRFYVSIDFLGGKEFSSPEVAKAATAAPLQINKQFTFPVDSAHPAARDQLLRAMQPGAAAPLAEVKFRLYHAITADEGEELASGSLSLRKLWDDPRRQELASHRLELFDRTTRESSHVMVSTNVLPALRRLLEPSSARAR